MGAKRLLTRNPVLGRSGCGSSPWSFGDSHREAVNEAVRTTPSPRGAFRQYPSTGCRFRPVTGCSCTVRSTAARSSPSTAMRASRCMCSSASGGTVRVGLGQQQATAVVLGRLVRKTHRRCPAGVDPLSIGCPRTCEPSGDPRVGQLEPTAAAGGSAPGVVTVVRSVDGRGHVLPPASPPIEHPRQGEQDKRHTQDHYPGVHRGLHRPPQCAVPGPFASIAESPQTVSSVVWISDTRCHR